MDLMIILTTESDSSLAKLLAEDLLKSKLAFCVGFHDSKSLYWWKDNIELTSEVQLVIKSLDYKLDKLLERIEEKSSYEVPEIIYWKASSGGDYSNWIESVI